MTIAELQKLEKAANLSDVEVVLDKPRHARIRVHSIWRGMDEFKCEFLEVLPKIIRDVQTSRTAEDLLQAFAAMLWVCLVDEDATLKVADVVRILREQGLEPADWDWHWSPRAGQLAMTLFKAGIEYAAWLTEIVGIHGRPTGFRPQDWN